MPTTTKGGASNQWLELEPDYIPPQQAADVPEVTEVTDEQPTAAQVKQPKKRVSRGSKDV